MPTIASATRCISQKKFDEAIGEYRQVVKIKPDHVFAHYYLGAALDYLKKYDEAIGEYRQVVESSRTTPKPTTISASL